jgi:GxxExxY protein
VLVLIAGELTEQVIGLVAIPVIYKAMPIRDGSRGDIVVVREVILEIKSVAAILPAHEAQLHTRSGWA